MSIFIRLFVFFTFFSFSQNKYEYIGVLKLNGDNSTVISYRLVFTEDNGQIIGYSVTDMEGKHETKNEIRGTFNKKTNELIFKEQSILYTKSKIESSSFCFVNFKGKVKIINQNSKIEGAFKGLFENNKKCIDGDITLVGNDKLIKQLTKINKKLQKTSRVTNKQKKDLNPLRILDSLKLNRISADENLSIFSWSNAIKIEFWDAGKEDGDVVNLFHNGKVVLRNYNVKNHKRRLDFTLVNGDNIFEIEAVSEGAILPSTPKINIIDKERNYEMMANLKKGEKAKLTIIKKAP